MNFSSNPMLKKEVVTDLEKIIQARDETVASLKKTIEDKDMRIQTNKSVFFENLSCFPRQEKRIQDLEKEINALKDDKSELNKYIENRLNEDIRRDMEQLKYEQEVFTAEKTAFSKDAEEQRSHLKALSSEVDQKQKAVEIRENNVSEREEKIQKREDEFNTYQNGMNELLQKIITTVDSRVKKLTN
jgi:DNA repair exonuclease SbcCD ATPase subunit